MLHNTLQAARDDCKASTLPHMRTKQSTVWHRVYRSSRGIFFSVDLFISLRRLFLVQKGFDEKQEVAKWKEVNVNMFTKIKRQSRIHCGLTLEKWVDKEHSLSLSLIKTGGNDKWPGWQKGDVINKRPEFCLFEPRSNFSWHQNTIVPQCQAPSTWNKGIEKKA